jgi:DNA-directed RNA polymerase beta subunit
MLGSKVTNRYGGKGVVSKILPDSEMPIMVDKSGNKKVVEVVMNPYSTINRKIPSVLMENALGLVCHRIKDLVEGYKSTKEGQTKIKPLLTKYYPGRFDSMTVPQIIKMHDTSKIENMYYFNVGSYTTKFTPDLINQWMDELGEEPQSKILMPQSQLADLGELKKSLADEDYKSVVSKMTGKYVEVDRPLMCGYVTMLELFKIPYYDEKTTSSLFMPDGDINPFKDSPILGHGQYRTTGQKIGEMELSAYLSRGAKQFIEYSRGDTSAQDAIEFMNNLLGLGVTIKNEQGYNMGASSLRNSLGEMKVKFRLKNKK